MVNDMAKDLFKDLETNIEDKYKRKNEEIKFQEECKIYEERIDSLKKKEHNLSWVSLVKYLNQELCDNSKYIKGIKNYDLFRELLKEAEEILLNEQKRLEEIERNKVIDHQNYLKSCAKELDEKINALINIPKKLRRLYWINNYNNLKTIISNTDKEVISYCANIGLFINLEKEINICKLANEIDDLLIAYKDHNVEYRDIAKLEKYFSLIDEDVKEYLRHDDFLDIVLNKIKVIQERDERLKQWKELAKIEDSQIMQLNNVSKNKRDEKWCNDVVKLNERINSCTHLPFIDNMDILADLLKEVEEINKAKEVYAKFESFIILPLDKNLCDEILQYDASLDANLKKRVKDIRTELLRYVESFLEKHNKKIFEEERIKKLEENKILKEKIINDIKGWKVGKTVFFGSYLQEKENEKEPIEWIVLEKTKTKITLLSLKVLDKCIYHNLDLLYKKAEKHRKPYSYYPDDRGIYEMNYAYNWRVSTLRSFLNNEFYNTAFNDAEKELITEEKNCTKGIYFKMRYNLLSEEKVCVLDNIKKLKKKYCKAQATLYAKKNGVKVDIKNNCNWWLREAQIYNQKTKGRVNDYADGYSYYVDFFGKVVPELIYTKANYQNNQNKQPIIDFQNTIGVRPVIVFKLNKD